MGELQITEIACETAYEFVDYLRLSKEHWGDLKSSQRPWIFRGQLDSMWDIKPSLFRKREFDKSNLIYILKEKELSLLMEKSGKRNFLSNPAIRAISENNYTSPNIKECILYYFLEKRLIREFILAADYHAFDILIDEDFTSLDNLTIDDSLKLLHESIPLDFTELEPQLQFDYLKNKKFIPKSYIGLAQHHGIYTRFIDFTYNPLTAAYFSSCSFKPDFTDFGKKIVVWAVNKHVFSPNLRAYINKGSSLASYQLYESSRNSNTYLQRQEGLFIYPEFPYEYYAKYGSFPAFEEYLKCLPHTYLDYNVKKITLPYSKVFELILILQRENVHLINMMPTLDNVAESLRLKWKWETWTDNSVS